MTLPIRNARLQLSQGQIFWREVGSGQTLVFLHGAWGDSNQWLPWMTQLGSRYHCVAIDLLGFGESERPKRHYSIEFEVECLAELLEALKLRQVTFVGDSIGAWIAAIYALRFPNQVKALILQSPAGIITTGNRWRSIRWRLMRWLLVPQIAGRILRSLLPSTRRQRHSSVRQPSQSPAASKLLFARRYSEIQAESWRDRLPWLKLPILLLEADSDSSKVKAANQAIATAAPFVQTHSCHQFDETIAAIDRFLQSTR